nr:MAG TPA: hypothetical protein [Caudoviricetes sp.]
MTFTSRSVMLNATKPTELRKGRADKADRN